MDKLHQYSFVLLRVGIAFVMIWFGLQQLSDASSWVGFLPDWINLLPLSQVAFVHLNGLFEIVFGTLLLLGFFKRLAAILLGLHLLGTTITIGYTALGVRDFGLTIALFSIALSNDNAFSLDSALEKKTKTTI